MDVESLVLEHHPDIMVLTDVLDRRLVVEAQKQFGHRSTCVLVLPSGGSCLDQPVQLAGFT